LIDEEVGYVALVVFAEGEVAVEEVVVGIHVLEEFLAVDDGDHGVEAGDVRQGDADFVGIAEGGGDGHGFGDAGGFNEEVVEALFGGEEGHLFEEIFAKGAADAAVGHFDEFFAGADEGGVDIDFAHVVDNDGDFQAFLVVEDVIEEGGLAGTEEAGENGNGKPIGIGHSLSIIAKMGLWKNFKE
jgi:hypothetical protein